MKVKEIAKAAVAVKTVLKYRRDWNKEGPAVKALRKFMPKDSKSFRLYIPIGPEAAEVLGGKKNRVKIVVPPAVRLALKRKGFRVTDYKAKRCVKIGDKEQRNEFNIGKIIADDHVAKMAFDNDPQLQNSENAKKGGGVMVVISCHPADIISMSTGRDWDHTSCMRLKEPLNRHKEAGVNAHYLKNDVAEGTLVAYAVRADDPKIKEPMCRVLLKPFIRVTDEHDDSNFDEDDEKPHLHKQNDGSRDVYYRREPTIYGNPVAGFANIVERFIRVLNKNPIPGEYFLAKRLYDDGVGSRRGDVVVRDNRNGSEGIGIIEEYDTALESYENDGGRVYAKKVVDVLFSHYNADARLNKVAKVVSFISETSKGADKATIDRILKGVMNAGHDVASAVSKDLKKYRTDTVEGIIDLGITNPSVSVGILLTIFNSEAMKPYKELALARLDENEAVMEEGAPKRTIVAQIRAALDKNWLSSLPESSWDDEDYDGSAYNVAMMTMRNGYEFNIRNIPQRVKAEMWAWATIVRGSEIYEKGSAVAETGNRLLMRMKPEYPGNKEELAKKALSLGYPPIGAFVYAATTFLKGCSDVDFIDMHHDKFAKIIEDRRMYRDMLKTNNPLYEKYLNDAIHNVVTGFFARRNGGVYVDERNRHLLSVMQDYIKSVHYELDCLSWFFDKRMFEKAFKVCPEMLGYLEHNFEQRASKEIVKAFANALTDNANIPATPIVANTGYATDLFAITGSLLKMSGRADVSNQIAFEYIEDIKKINALCKQNFQADVFTMKPTSVELDPLSFGIDLLFEPEIGIRSLAYSNINAMNASITEFVKRLKTHSASVHDRLHLLEEYCSYMYGEVQTNKDEHDFENDVEERVDELRASGDYEADEDGEEDQSIWDDARSEIEDEYRKLYRAGFDCVESLDFVLENFVYDEDEDDAADFFKGASEEEIADEFDDIIALREQIQEWRDEIYSGAAEIQKFL